MKRIIMAAIAFTIAALAFLFAPLAMLGCSAGQARQQADVASGFAIVANTGLDVLGKVYERQMVDAVLAAADAKYPDEETRNNAINHASDVVIERWRPLWGDPPDVPNGKVGTWTIFRAAHTAWAEAIERGESGDALVVQVRAAYCALMSSLPEDARPLVKVDVIVCGIGPGVSLPDSGVLPLVDGGVR